MHFSCLSCDKTLESVDGGDSDVTSVETATNVYDGVACMTSGNYGSKVFDSFDGSYLFFHVCDECLTKKKQHLFLVKGSADSGPSLWREVQATGQ